jgi:hypothetical protein
MTAVKKDTIFGAARKNFKLSYFVMALVVLGWSVVLNFFGNLPNCCNFEDSFSSFHGQNKNKIRVSVHCTICNKNYIT